MAGFKVSYKILREQGEGMKNVSKTFDKYMDEIAKISSHLGTEEMLAQVRSNLGKLQDQLSQVSELLFMAGDVLVKAVEKYSGTEKRQVKRTSGTKAHSRDFYKRPVVVVPAGSSSTTTTTTTNTYVDQSTHVTYNTTTGAMPATDYSSGPGGSFGAGSVDSVGPVGAAAAAAHTSIDAGDASKLAGAAALGVVGAATLGLHQKDKRDARKDAEGRAKSVDTEALSEQIDTIIEEARKD
ncbi:MAG: hypothetical protein LBJ61_02100 [Deltaproteobacteria bacterium]|jgi:hypothetical protein|nr:hypothetical protein [Deltaproteobacteria bacterium]